MTVQLPDPLPGLSDAYARADADMLRAVIDRLPHGLCVFDAQDRLVMSNRRWREIWNLPEALARPGTAFADIIAASHGVETEDSRSRPVPLPEASGEVRRRREWIREDGRVIEVTVTRQPDGGCVALHEDVTERRAVESRVAYLAWHDELTGLPNRGRLRVELERTLADLNGREVALLTIDLDRFKPVNDSFGHSIGDAVLREVARRLRDCVRGGDFIARLGGDEFAVVQAGAGQPRASTQLGRRLVQRLAEPFEIAGHNLRLGASVGVAIAPFDASDVDRLQSHADLALYAAKGDGRGTVRYFEPSMDDAARRRQSMEQELREALARDEFELHYQPQVNLADRRLTGFEALLRWRRRDGSLASPAEFIPLAEETGLIVPIGRWVLETACREATRWPLPLPVAVNVSAVQFRQRAVLHDVADALNATGLPAERLEVEITESVMLGDMQQALDVLGRLRGMGVRVAMDDFGTGFSSLSLLRTVAFTRLKIDRSFISDLEPEGDSVSIVRTVVALGRSLGLRTTVEGVETQTQHDIVLREACDDGQGWLFGRPLPADKLHTLFSPPVAS